MIKKILFPTDFSDVADKAIEFIKDFKKCGAGEVVVLHVIDETSLYHMEHYVSQYADISPIMQKMEEDRAKALKGVADKLTNAGFKVKTRLERGTPFSKILRIEQEEAVSLIVIGSHGKSNIAEMLLGSVSEKVLRKAKGPVVLVKR